MATASITSKSAIKYKKGEVSKAEMKKLYLSMLYPRLIEEAISHTKSNFYTKENMIDGINEFNAERVSIFPNP